MAINSKIILAKGVRIDKNYINVLSYTENQMLSLLRENSHKIYEASNYSFIDEFQNIINVQVPYGDCIALNYMAFQNPRYDNKWFFAFVDKIEYNSEKSTNITFHIDSWTTWHNNLTQNSCYVIREHVSNDTIGANRVEENLDIGNVECRATSEEYSTASNPWVCVMSNYSPENQTNYAGIQIYNKGVFGTRLFLFQFNELTYLEDLMKFLLVTNADGYISSVTNIFVIPEALLTIADLELHHVDTGTRTTGNTGIGSFVFDFYTMPFSMSIKSIAAGIDKKLSWSDYSPKNNKCFCWPYNYVIASNNMGNENIFKYEDFSDTNCKFDIDLVLTPRSFWKTYSKKL